MDHARRNPTTVQVRQRTIFNFPHQSNKTSFSAVNTNQCQRLVCRPKKPKNKQQVDETPGRGPKRMFGDLADPERIDEGGECERCYVPQRLHNSTEAMRAAVFSDRGLIVYLNGRGWLGQMWVGQQREEKPAHDGTNLSRNRSSGEPKRGQPGTDP